MRSIARGMMCSKHKCTVRFGLPPMDPHLPYDVDSVSWPFPASGSLGSVSLPDDWEGVSSGRKFPSTGTIPILLFGDDDVGDLLESDSASLPPPFGIPNNLTGYRVVRDRSSAILRLDDVGSSTARASSVERPESSCGRKNERKGFNHSHYRPVRLDAVDGVPSYGESADDDRKDDHGEKDLSAFFNTESTGPPSAAVSCSEGPRRSRCRPFPSRSSSLGCVSRGSAPVEAGTRSAQRTCYDSCGASPAAITNPPLIEAAKHTQNFALEDDTLPIRQPSSNSFSLYDCLHQLNPPLTSNHDNDQRYPCGASSSTFSSAEADLSIDFPPRDRMTDHSFPSQYSPSIEPSSSSSSSSSNLPDHLAWLQDVTISLCVDQESFRTVFPSFKLVGYTKPTLSIRSSPAGTQKQFAGGNDGNSCGGSPTKQHQQQHHSDLVDQASTGPDSTGMAEFMPVKRESFVFHHSPLDPPPSVRRLSVNGDESRDYLSQYAHLSIKSTGGFQVYVVRGSETRRGGSDADGETATSARSARVWGSSAIKLEWRFEYAVEDKRKADGTKAGDGEKFLTPLRFSCSPGLLHPKQGRKVTVLSVWKKSLQPRVLASRLQPLTITSPATPRSQTRHLSPLSSPTSPKSAGVGGLRFPSASRLWGKRTKASPYPFDKGSDGSEEELIPSESSAHRRRKRPNSTYLPRVPLDASEWPQLQMWDRDRGQSADAVWQTNRDVRPSTAGAGGSRNRAQSFGRGAASEGENGASPSSRSRAGLSTTRHAGYRPRRPRTAR